MIVDEVFYLARIKFLGDYLLVLIQDEKGGGAAHVVEVTKVCLIVGIGKVDPVQAIASNVFPPAWLVVGDVDGKYLDVFPPEFRVGVIEDRCFLLTMTAVGVVEIQHRVICPDVFI